MRHKQLIHIIGCICLVVACSTVKENEATHKILIDVDPKISEAVSIYDMFSKVELIELDDSYPVSNHVHVGASNIAFDGHLFYILDMKSLVVNVYDKKGFLVCHADKIGRGPGEYTMADQIFYNPQSGMIEILNPMCKILRYSTDSMRFHSVVDFSGQELLASHNFYHSNDGYTVYSFSAEDQLWSLKQENGKLESYGYSYPKHLRKYISVQNPFFEMDNNICFLQPHDGRIYTFDESDNVIKPFIEWDFGSYNCNIDDIPEDFTVRDYGDFITQYSNNHVAAFIDVKVSGTRLFASTIFDRGKIYTLYYDLDSEECYFFDKTIEGMEFLPELFADEVMYKFVDSHFLPDYINRDILDGKSQLAYDNIIANDGSAILVYHLK